MSIENELITVVVCVRNRALLLAEMLESLRRQRVRRFRLIVVDNGSTDGSGDVARAWASDNQDIPTLVLEEKTPGAARARNAGLRAVETPWTLFFDSDDLMAPGHISNILASINARPEVELWGWDIVCPDGHIGRFPRHLTLWPAIIGGCMATARYCARTELFRRAGGWNEELALWDDIDLGVRLIAWKPRTGRVKQTPGVIARPGPDSISGNSAQSTIDRMETPLRSLENNLAPDARFILDVKRTQCLAIASRERVPGMRMRLASLLDGSSGAFRRAALRMIFATVKRGIPGTHLLLKPFYDIKY